MSTGSSFNDPAVSIVSCRSGTVSRKAQHIPHTKLNCDLKKKRLEAFKDEYKIPDY